MKAKVERAYLDVQEAAAYTGRSAATIGEAARSGELRGAQAKARGKWAFRRDDLDRWMEGRPARVDGAA